MKLYEPISVTYILISVLIFVIWGGLHKGFMNAAESNCHEHNEQLLSEQREGPLRQC